MIRPSLERSCLLHIVAANVDTLAFPDALLLHVCMYTYMKCLAHGEHCESTCMHHHKHKLRY